MSKESVFKYTLRVDNTSGILSALENYEIARVDYECQQIGAVRITMQLLIRYKNNPVSALA